MKQYLSITEAAEFLGVSRPTVYARLKSGELPYNQVGERTIRIPIAAITALQVSTHKTTKNQHLTIHDLRSYMTRAEVLKEYGVEKSKFHKVMRNNGIKAVRHGKKAVYLKSQMKELFYSRTYHDIKDWYTSEELAAREGISRRRVCVVAHKMGIAVKRAGTVCYIAKEGWDDRKLAPAVIEKEYMTVAEATRHYHIGKARFYDGVNGTDIKKVRKGKYVYFPVRELDRLFGAKEPEVPEDIRKNYVKSGEVTRMYHIGQDRFLKETREACVEKVRTEGGFVWYRKDQLDRLFRKIM